jgi:hypothetical protein
VGSSVGSFVGSFVGWVVGVLSVGRREGPKLGIIETEGATETEGALETEGESVGCPVGRFPWRERSVSIESRGCSPVMAPTSERKRIRRTILKSKELKTKTQHCILGLAKKGNRDRHQSKDTFPQKKKEVDKFREEQYQVIDLYT